ncbi:hypothetical protein ZWY2020_012618 [Hordeum vulgare]|nr:hypothetical protein ZWY2020_012618 [Hordeum vulgare]
MAGRPAEEEEVPALGMPRKSLEESNMDHLQDEMQRLLRSSSTNGRDAVRSSWLKSERCLRALDLPTTVYLRPPASMISVPETAHHLLLDCPFAKETWQSFASAQPEASAAALSSTSINSWWAATTDCKGMHGNIHPCRDGGGVHAWNKRNRRVFQQKFATAHGLHAMIRDEISLFVGAWDG